VKDQIEPKSVTVSRTSLSVSGREQADIGERIKGSWLLLDEGLILVIRPLVYPCYND